ncbi:copper chaperone PCu(A)C [Methylobacterium sp. J-090]|uniref:copper chaperone PCu(A)C n=1 Tax=Methylobacterium sp. J-090 TaxID=2836666 RepID=UPI00391B182A
MNRRHRTLLRLALSAMAAIGFAAHACAGEPITAGSLRIETPWMRATPGGAKVAGGYVRITNTGTQADRLTGAAIAIAGRGTIHSMTMAGSVMKMAPVPEGLPIGPGETIELKPGGLHLMFEDLNAAPKVHEPVSGTLTFERTGAVPVTFAVAPIGAMSPDTTAPAVQAPHHHH